LYICRKFLFLNYIIENFGSTGERSSFIPNFLRNSHTAFHHGYTNLHSHQQCTSFPFLYIFTNTCNGLSCFLNKNIFIIIVGSGYVVTFTKVFRIHRFSSLFFLHNIVCPLLPWLFMRRVKQRKLSIYHLVPPLTTFKISFWFCPWSCFSSSSPWGYVCLGVWVIQNKKKGKVW
jgi:hypothetical protein